MPMRRDQLLPELCPPTALRSPSNPRLHAVLRRAVRAAFATTVLSAAACSNSHTDVLPTARGGSGSPEAGAAGGGTPSDRPSTPTSPSPGVKPPSTTPPSTTPSTPTGPTKGGDKGTDATCKDSIWQPLEGLEPTEEVDYIAFLAAFQNGMPARERATRGTACENAAASCEMQLAAARVPTDLKIDQSCGQVGFCREFVVTTVGDAVKRYATREELLEFLGPINTPQEAFFLLAYDRYVIVCGDVIASGNAPLFYAKAKAATVIETADGFEATVLWMADDCPITYEQVVVSVSRAGEVKELKREPLPSSNACAGRRPEGWVAAHASFSGSLLADHFARMAELEAASVTAFKVVAVELEHHGAPAELVARLRAAAREEVSHARVTTDLARALGAEPKLAPIESRPIRSVEAIALDNAVEGCVRETFGAAVGCYQAEAACDPAIAALMRQVSIDEMGHAALAFDLHDWIMPRLSAAARARVVAARTAAVAALEAELTAEPGTTLREQAGMPGPNEAAKLHASLRQELWA